MTSEPSTLTATSGGTSTLTAKPLRATSVHKLLTNPYYCGIVEYQGRRMCLADFADEVGINRGTMKSRLKLGWSVEEAASIPVAKTSRWPSRTVQ